jgi:NAD(P)H-flavin reductase/formate hydrogenlyase subunit 6/NADH:ubiquinone oxidoreductase subunit I
VTDPTTHFLARDELDRLIARLREDGRRVIGPTVVDGAVSYEEIESSADLPIGLRDDQAAGSYRLVGSGRQRAFDVAVGMTSWKGRTFPSRVPLTRARTGAAGTTFTEEDPAVEPMAFLGVRACELAALRVQDRVLADGPFVDADYAARRDDAFVIAVQCSRASATCFCTSMGTGPEVTDGFDLALAELDDGYLMRAGSRRGEAMLATLPAQPATAEQERTAAAEVAAVRSAIGRPVATDGLHDRLLDALDSPRWAEVGDRCLACANCTLVCPTCFCTSVVQRSDLDGAVTVSERTWDSCFTAGFAKVAGGSFRNRRQDRYRQWLTHKFATWIDQFGTFGCVGCGRCIAWCPVGIDVREELAAIAPPAERLRRAPNLPAGTGPSTYSTGIIRSVAPETADTFTLVIDRLDPIMTTGTPGQFLMVEQPGLPSFPISVSRYGRDHVVLTVRAAGPATAKLTRSEPGTEVGLRGPLGVGWPVERALGKDAVIITGGIGLAPLRPLIDALVAARDRFGKVVLYYGARTPRDQLYLPELASWPDLGIEVAQTVDRAGPEWLGRVGVVTQLFDQEDFHGSPTVAYICGPERMMQAAVRTVGERGIPAERTFVSLERHMECGIGLCGHCQMGRYFICRDGPVFSLAQLGDALNVEGL